MNIGKNVLRLSKRTPFYSSSVLCTKDLESWNPNICCLLTLVITIIWKCSGILMSSYHWDLRQHAVLHSIVSRVLRYVGINKNFGWVLRWKEYGKWKENKICINGRDHYALVHYSYWKIQKGPQDTRQHMEVWWTWQSTFRWLADWCWNVESHSAWRGW